MLAEPKLVLDLPQRLVHLPQFGVEPFELLRRGHSPRPDLYQSVEFGPDIAQLGRIGAFIWTYDSTARAYRNVHRRISADGGHSWSEAADLGFADQAGRPVVLPDGRVLLPWVDRFGTRSIRASIAPALDAPFDPDSEVVLYTLDQDRARGADDSTGALLAVMSLWTFGLPYAEALPDGDVLVAYYAGTEAAMDIRWARLQLR